MYPILSTFVASFATAAEPDTTLPSRMTYFAVFGSLGNFIIKNFNLDSEAEIQSKHSLVMNSLLLVSSLN